MQVGLVRVGEKTKVIRKEERGISEVRPGGLYIHVCT